MNNIKKAKFLAKKRQDEISRKNDHAIKSGNVKSTHSALTNENRLIKCDHYRRKGNDLKLSNKRDEIARLKREVSYLRGESYRIVKRDSEGKTTQVYECVKPR